MPGVKEGQSRTISRFDFPFLELDFGRQLAISQSTSGFATRGFDFDERGVKLP